MILDAGLASYTLDNLNQPNPICLACKPAFSPVLNATSNDQNNSLNFKYILSCETIVNCEFS